MIGHISKLKVGRIVHDPRLEEWYIVTKADPRWAQMACFVGTPDRARMTFGIGGSSDGDLVPASKVPDHVWAALAAWRLTR